MRRVRLELAKFHCFLKGHKDVTRMEQSDRILPAYIVYCIRCTRSYKI